jgi:phosphatidyl-myo-inositol alpha-mannosyltransferase
MRIGIVCPYLWDIPGGVQSHVRDLAETLIALGHQVSVLAPGDEDSPDLPSYVVAAGKTVPIPYNGSVARLQFGLVSATRVRRWLRQGDFQVVHVHEPAPPSLSLLTVLLADVPLVATFHAASTRSRFLAMFDSVVQAVLERLSGRIAVSPAARKLIVEHLGGDAVVIPNGVSVAHFAQAPPLPGYPREPAAGGGTIGFLGRYDEPRKGMTVLLAAMEQLIRCRPEVQLLIGGRGQQQDFLDELPRSLQGAVVMLGMLSEADKASMLRSVDAYVAPNTGGESFGIILVEAMSAGAPVLASDLDAFAQVLDQGAAGELFPNEDADALAAAALRLLANPARRAELRERGSAHVRRFDWSTVGADILSVYETVTAGAAAVAAAEDERGPGLRSRLGLARD